MKYWPILVSHISALPIVTTVFQFARQFFVALVQFTIERWTFLPHPFQPFCMSFWHIRHKRQKIRNKNIFDRSRAKYFLFRRIKYCSFRRRHRPNAKWNRFLSICNTRHVRHQTEMYRGGNRWDYKCNSYSISTISKNDKSRCALCVNEFCRWIATFCRFVQWRTNWMGRSYRENRWSFSHGIISNEKRWFTRENWFCVLWKYVSSNWIPNGSVTIGFLVRSTTWTHQRNGEIMISRIH